MLSAMFDTLWSERSKWAAPKRRLALREHFAIPNLDAKTAEFLNSALPRGVLAGRLEPDRERVNYFMSPQRLMREHRHVQGQIILGKLGATPIGHLDDRPMVTVATARTGKTSTILIPNLCHYPGSMLVLDPKAELAQTAPIRRALGHRVVVLDPFAVSGQASARYNPLSELDVNSLDLIDDVASIVNALVPDDGDPRSAHWTQNARELLMGLILFTLSTSPQERHLVTVRKLLCLSYGPLVEAAKLAAKQYNARMKKSEKAEFFEINQRATSMLFSKLVSLGDRFGGVAADIGNRFLQMPTQERGSVFSTAAVHTDFIDSLRMRQALIHSDFRLSDLRGDRPTTIFLCLPVGRMERHAKWLRLIVQLTCIVLEGMGTYPRTRPPILFMMEEFATLGHMEIMERAAAYFPGFGVKLWAILQDVTQLQRYYKSSWATFLANSGLLQFFANGDQETLKFIEGHVDKLITASELRLAFSRERNSQLILMEGQPAAAALRLNHADVERIAARAMSSCVGLPPL